MFAAPLGDPASGKYRVIDSPAYPIRHRAKLDRAVLKLVFVLASCVGKTSGCFLLGEAITW